MGYCLLYVKASGIYKNEDTRRSAIRLELLNVLSVGMEKIVNLDSTSADGVVVTQTLMMGEVAAIVIEGTRTNLATELRSFNPGRFIVWSVWGTQPNVSASNLLLSIL
jgi:hypothetical protein